MTDMPDLPDELVAWAQTPLYSSAMFGGSGKEKWTPEQTGRLFLGFWMLNDGFTVLRRLMALMPSDDPERRGAYINEATVWLEAVTDWVRQYSVDGDIPPDSELGELLDEIQGNLLFLTEGVSEHVNRIG